VTLGLYDHDLPPMSEELDLRMRRAAEELWSIGSELLKQPSPSAEANGGDVGSAACHELQAAVDQFRHLIWTKIEEANAPSALGTEEALLALRLRRSAEMLRLACCLAVDRGVEVCAPVHDAVLVCAQDAGIETAVATMRGAMSDASKIVLDGFELDTDAEIVRWPDRYADKRGTIMWNRVMGLIGDDDND